MGPRYVIYESFYSAKALGYGMSYTADEVDATWI